MVDVHRYHEISESTHRIMNPLSLEKVMAAGASCGLAPDERVLDLACGKGELLCQYAARFRTIGVGIDVYPPLVAIARDRAAELKVASRVTFVEGDAADPDAPFDGPFDVVSCIGATWIGGGLVGTLDLMLRPASPTAWLLVGEVYWARPPTAELAARHGEPDTFVDLSGTLERFESRDLELVDVQLANQDEWDYYAASQWLNVERWLDASPDDPDAAAVRIERDQSRRQYLADERGVIGWGVFVLRRR